jgi:hypothetical protein
MKQSMHKSPFLRKEPKCTAAFTPPQSLSKPVKTIHSPFPPPALTLLEPFQQDERSTFWTASAIRGAFFAHTKFCKMGCGASVPATEEMKGKRVVILGFGPAGSTAAASLAGKVHLTIVHKLDTFHHNMYVTAS